MSKDEERDYPENINPNANSSGLLAIERAKLAMSLNDQDSPESNEFRKALIEEENLLLDEKE